MSPISKITKWEFWPFWVFYLPVYLLYFWYSFRARSLVFFSAANPIMEMGGFADYSKWKVLSKIDDEFVPSTVYVESSDSLQLILNRIMQHQLSYPMLVKPDKGERGYKVELVNTENELIDYLSTGHYPLLIQEYIDYELELGIMYHRMPNEEKGKITSIVQKDFLHVTGDGKSSLEQLFDLEYRTLIHKERMVELYKEDLKLVIPAGQKKILEPIGNHCRGTAFLNANKLMEPKLELVFDHIAKQIPGFHFGRFDIRVKSSKDLYAGKNIKVLEVNGANSEPAHIYDPGMPLLKAYKHLFAHWKHLFKVSVQSHKNGAAYMPIVEAYLKTRRYFKERKHVAENSLTKKQTELV